MGNVPNGNTEIADWLLSLIERQKRWGFGLCFLYCAMCRALAGATSRYIAFTESLPHLRITKSRHSLKQVSGQTGVSGAYEPNVAIGLYDMSNWDRRMFWTFCVFDNHSLECLCMKIDVSLPMWRILRALDLAVEQRGSQLSFPKLRLSRCYHTADIDALPR